MTVSDFGVSIGGTPNPRDVAGWSVVSAVGAILNNPWQHARLESIQRN